MTTRIGREGEVPEGFGFCQTWGQENGVYRQKFTASIGEDGRLGVSLEAYYTENGVPRNESHEDYVSYFPKPEEVVALRNLVEKYLSQSHIAAQVEDIDDTLSLRTRLALAVAALERIYNEGTEPVSRAICVQALDQIKGKE